MSKLNLAMWVACTHSEGPGARFALWTQGCLSRCPGCCNPELWDIVPRHVLAPGDILDRIAAAKRQHAIEGATFIGGEPFLQARGLAEVAAGCHELGLTVMVFTGQWREDLVDDAFAGASALLAACDLLVDGPYDVRQPEHERNWAGSCNQRFHFISDAYHPGIERDPRYRPSVEFRFGRAGELRINGWPTMIADSLNEKE